MTALEYFRLFATEFECVADATVLQWLTVSDSLANTDCLDVEQAAMAKALYAAHTLAIASRTAQSGSQVAGAITSEREGDLQRSYGNVKGSDTYLGQTSYGQQYLDITKACYGSAIMTRVDNVIY
jgi:hypothetical protein